MFIFTAHYQPTDGAIYDHSFVSLDSFVNLVMCKDASENQLVS